MTITSEIKRVQTNIANAYTSLEAKGATMPDIRNSANLASTINSVPSGSSGNVVESIALGTATNAQVGDKVLLNPAIALQDPVELEYTKTANDYFGIIINQKNAPNVGVFSRSKGIAEMPADKNATLVDQKFTWDSEQNKYIGTNGSVGKGWHVVWGTPTQMYYATCSTYNGFVYGSAGTVSSDLSFNETGILPKDSEYGIVHFLITYKDYCTCSNANFCFRISNTAIEQKKLENNTCNGIIEYNGKVYFTLGFNGSPLYRWNAKSFEDSSSLSIRGFGDIKPGAIACLDSNSNYIIAGPYGTPAQFKIFKQLPTSDASNLNVEEDAALTALLPINSESATSCNFYVIPIQDGQDFADIFIRYGSRLFYCKWDGTTLTNYGLITDRGERFSFNPVERILFTNMKTAENTSDYQVFSFQGIMNKPFTAMDMTSRNWSQQTLTGFVKSNEGQDEFGNTILKVNTTTDPNVEPWSDVGKLYGFNVSVEEGSNE